ncbi:hypothetical protein NUW58_g7633 [Xylaria curta]|uniref:Uncharacterized protein n=1 Tax=Xylaria curta TaxID=42375 RepID=A0ACC1NHD0_9PEZI|nr:hypothetical protein NUW58_g7633 [Xylaria curta]
MCSLLACDPLFSDIKSPQPINSTIDLVFSNGHTNLVTRITSTGEAVDPTQLPFMQKLIVVFRCLWIRLVAFTRISKEVAALVFGQGFDVREYLGLSTEAKSRYANETERGLEAVFRSYLRHLVRQSPLSLSVRYIPDGVPYVSDELMLSIAAEGKPDTAAHLEFKVLTPAFYPRFVHYAHDFEAMFCEFNEHRTIWLSEPTLLPKLVLKKPPPPLTTESYIDYGYFTAIKRLRKLPKKIEWPPASGQTVLTQSLRDIRGFRLSSMDGYVLAHEEDKIRYMYRHLVLRLFIADRIAYGNTYVLSLVTLPLRLLLAWAAVSPG